MCIRDRCFTANNCIPTLDAVLHAYTLFATDAQPHKHWRNYASASIAAVDRLPHKLWGHHNSTHTMIDSCNTVLPLLIYCEVIVSWLSSILCGVLWKSTVDIWTPARRGGKLCCPIERCEGQRCGLTVRTRWRKSTVGFCTPASRGGKKMKKKSKKSSKRCCAL